MKAHGNPLVGPVGVRCQRGDYGVESGRHGAREAFDGAMVGALKAASFTYISCHTLRLPGAPEKLEAAVFRIRSAIVLGVLAVWGVGCAQQQANGIYDSGTGSPNGDNLSDGGDDADGADGADGGDGTDGDADVLMDDTGAQGMDIGPVFSIDTGTVTGFDTGTPTGTVRDSGTRRDTGTVRDTGTSGSTCSHSSCGTCTAVNNCGWCASSNRCLAGTPSGPSSGSCSPTAWAWQPADCSTVTGPSSDPCTGTYSACGTCTASATCGWCASTSQCMTSNLSGTGPQVGSCASWALIPPDCTTGGTGPTTDPCAGAAACGTCVTNTHCGWCVSSADCHYATTRRSGPDDGACSGADWAYSVSHCP